MRIARYKSKKKQRPEKRKIHDNLVKKICEYPEILEIEGLTNEKIVARKSFPTNDKGIETGDIVFIWQVSPKIWEILIVEITCSIFRTLNHEFIKISKSTEFFLSDRNNLFENLGVDLPENHNLQVRGVAVSYAGKATWSKPFVTLGDIHLKR